jgi:hypothetical protein
MKERRKEKKEILGVDIEIQWQVRVEPWEALGPILATKVVD